MRLILREYLAMMRESGELDVLIPDLLLAMGLEPLTRPSSGSRQFGVDLPATGLDPDEPSAGEKLFLLTIKRGHITRSNWNSGPQSVRPSLDDILDNYLRMLVRPEHAQLPKKIVLVTGGDLRQDVKPDWTSYIHANRDRYLQYGPVEFDFWGGDKLATLLDAHLFDEFLFPESAQKQIRKTIALADESDEEPSQFYAFIEDMLHKRNLPTGPGSSDTHAREKAFVLINLSLLIVYRWCEETGNLRSAMLAAERTLLACWDWMRRCKLLECESSRASFAKLNETYRRIMRSFAEKLRGHSHVQDGLAAPDEIETALRVFDVIGLLGTATCAFAYEAASADTAASEEMATHAVDIGGILEGITRNNPAASLPRYDRHSIDIGTALIALSVAGPRNSSTADWLANIAASVTTAIKAKRHYPVASDSYEDLLAMRSATPPPREQLMELSTLLPMLAEWMAVLQADVVYARFCAEITETIPNTNLQLWFPDSSIDEYLYSTNAGYASGVTTASLTLPKDAAAMRARIATRAKSHDAYSSISCLSHGWPLGALLASRHFRTPIIPALWQTAVRDE